MTANTPIILVSGLPRSGTSMMMAMLQAGGVPILADSHRKADVGNPNGYFELAAAKAFDRDQSSMNGAGGHAVKVISFHLFHAPPAFRYHVLFMERPLSEVLASQRALLAAQGTPQSIDEDNLERLYTRHLDHVKAWLERQPNFSVARIPYHAAVERPRRIAATVGDFLGGGLDIRAMAAVVRPELHRQHAPEPGESKSHTRSTES